MEILYKKDIAFTCTKMVINPPWLNGRGKAALPAFPCLVFRKRWISRPRKQESGLRENCWGNDRVIAADQKENCNK